MSSLSDAVMNERLPQLSAPPFPTEDHHKMAEVLGIEPDHFVLDIGGGHNPFSRANVVVDIDLISGDHRDGNPIADKNPHMLYVQADICALPFRDKTFDMVVCLHVLEHALNPAKACEEIIRVSRRGFIETPRKWTEYYAGHPTHQWLVDECNGALTFEPVTFHESPFMSFALPSLWSSPELLNRYCLHHHIPCVQLLWDENFRYQVRGEVLPNSMAERHFYFARNLMYWMAPPDRFLYHARRAAELSRDNKRYSDFYAFSLALCGKWMKAVRQGLNAKHFVSAIFVYMISKISFWLSSLYRRMTNIWLTL